ncbi:MAG TPA: type II toxin-antitoxin system HicA family toxin [Clostridia bacterium]|nr:type II toxin-antitoxin system HicA family toxin [Clostridia bacterium]
MKRRDLIKKLRAAGWYLVRHGHDHDIYRHDNPPGERILVQVPRHREINEVTAKQILKDAGLK